MSVDSCHVKSESATFTQPLTGCLFLYLEYIYIYLNLNVLSEMFSDGRSVVTQRPGAGSRTTEGQDVGLDTE